jgi:putative ABC transport system ATP-binding protein
MMNSQLIKLQEITKKYSLGETEVHALRGISMEIHSGEFVAIMGASGSGKSTMMNILGCLDVPSSGTYSLDGIQIAALDRNELAGVRNNKIGFVFQSFNLLSRTTALENVELPLLYNHSIKPAIAREKALSALKSVGLEKRSMHFSSQLSGGQQQRVAIARAIVNNPSVILADEPTGNLDTQMSIEIMAIFQQLNNQGITVIIVTHEQDIAQYTKRIITFRDGHIISDEPVANQRNAAAERDSFNEGIR